MWTKSFWKGAGERLVKTGAQTLAASVTVGTVVTAIDWRTALGLTVTAMIASLLTSIGNASFVAGPPQIPTADGGEDLTITLYDEDSEVDTEPRHAEVIPDGEGVATN